MEYKEIAIYLLAVLQILVAYVYRNHVLQTKENFDKIEIKIKEMQSGDFIKNSVQNVIYLPESRDYFKSIFTEVLNHQKKNDNSVDLAILSMLEKIDSKLTKNKHE